MLLDKNYMKWDMLMKKNKFVNKVQIIKKDCIFI